MLIYLCPQESKHRCKKTCGEEAVCSEIRSSTSPFNTTEQTIKRAFPKNKHLSMAIKIATFSFQQIAWNASEICVSETYVLG
mmetsp:Transcript_43352/g.68636  ORF Transcript_43352/g.68636 Transcript_43352/m.68636 type:complete len:82 (+) Transcript_43352:92-337(+)